MLASKVGRIIILTLFDNRPPDVTRAAEQRLQLFAFVVTYGALQGA
jgi:hypothetical protein